MSSEHLSRLRAPRDHGQFLLHPPSERIADLLGENRRRLACPCGIVDDLAELRSAARTETLAAARDYLTAAGEPVSIPEAPHLFVAGHQPEFFHPGVWVKNFVLHALAKKHAGIALNIVVDDDTAKHTHLLVPSCDHVVKVGFDRWQSEVPFEERTVLDESLWTSLPERAGEITTTWPFRSWLDDVWAIAVQQKTPLLGERIVRTRRALERSIGIRPLEVPLSAICRTPAFAKFASLLVRELPDFQRAYNGSVGAYRERHELRSKNHPFPDLGRDRDRLEAPFWAWHRGDQRRLRLFVEKTANGRSLWAGTEAIGELVGPSASWPEQWLAFESRGIRIRTRALTTTLFSRLLLADVFMHGLGGGKYDEVTDDLIRTFFRIEPPQYLVATATLLLPLGCHQNADVDLARLRRLERDLWWNPQRHVADPGAGPVLAAKAAAQSLPESTHSERVERFRRLQETTAALRPFIELQRADSLRQVADAEDRAARLRIASSRDYAFPLYPESMLRDFFLRQMAAIGG